MKSIIRLGVFLLVALMVVSPAISTRAQDTCYGVPEADCKLVTEASANSAAFQQGFTMDYKIAFSGKGTSNGTDSSGAVNVSGSGVLGTAAAAAAGADPSAMMNAFLFSNVINFETSGSGTPQKGSIEVRVVNGNLYFKSDLMGGKWQYVTGAELQAALTSALSKMSSAGAGAGGTGGTGGMNPMSNPELLTALMAAPNIPGVITGEAADGPTVDGQATRKVTYNFDLATLIGAKEFRPVVKAALSQQAAGAEVTDAQIDENVQKATTALQNTKFSAYVLVGSADKITHGFGVSLNAVIDEATAKLMNSTGAGELNANFDITFSKVGQAVTVEAPADAVKFDMSMFGGASK